MATGATSYISSVGKREDLSNIIAVVDAAETVLTSTIKKGKKPANALTEWQVDTFDTPNTTGVIDGVDVTTAAQYTNAGALRARLGNYVQKWWRNPMVTDMEETLAVIAGIDSPDPHGVAGSTEFNRAKAKLSVTLKRDVEATLLSDNGAQADTGPGGVPFQTRGLGKWLSTVADTVQAQPASQLLSAAQVYDINVNGAQTMAAFTEDSLRALLSARWNQTKKKGSLIGIVGSAVKDAVSDFSRYQTNRTSNTAVRFYSQIPEKKTVTTTVDVYEGDYGDVEFFLSAFLPNTSRGYIIDPDYLELRTLRPPGFKPIPDLGGGPRGIIDTIAALAVLNAQAHVKIAGV